MVRNWNGMARKPSQSAKGMLCDRRPLSAGIGRQATLAETNTFSHSRRMSYIGDEIESRLAARIRAERDARGWSLAVLAERSGVSKAAISKIERGEASPTAAVLVRLATGFDTTLAGLLARAEGGGGRLARHADQPLWRDPATGYLRRRVFSRADHPLEMVEVELPPGREVSLPAASYTLIRQVVRVLEGQLVLAESGARHVLEAGDALGFGAPSDVTFANEGDAPCTYLVALARL